MHGRGLSGGSCFLALLLAACTSVPPGWSKRLPDPPSEAARASFGRIGLVLAATDAAPRLDAPPSRGGAVGIGAGKGALTVIAAGATAGPIGFALGVFLSPVGMLVGGVYGAVAAEDSEEVAAGRRRIVAALQESDFEARLVAALVRHSSVDAGRELRVLDERWDFPPSPERLAGTRAAGLDSVLVVRIGVLGLVAQTMDVAPTLHFACYSRAHLVRLADGAMLHELPLIWSSTTRLAGGWPAEDQGESFLDWSAVEARDLRAVLADASEATAERIVEELFLLHLTPESKLHPKFAQRPDDER